MWVKCIGFAHVVWDYADRFRVPAPARNGRDLELRQKQINGHEEDGNPLVLGTRNSAFDSHMPDITTKNAAVYPLADNE